ncbi:MAG: serine/threonine protein kinase, partial [Clostridiales bacterium]|nr:serine/threonine protein kinase [Clostridiales bacterium]
MDVNKLCYGCFNEREGTGPCPHCGFDISTAKHPYIALPIGTILNGRYLTGRVLGVGGFGVTYLAYDMTLEICVAVKEYLPSGIAIRDADHYTMTVNSQEEQTRYDTGANKFLDEARILAKLRKVPNIVTVHDYFRENNTAYFVMEYIEGEDLMKYTNARGGKLPFDEALALLLPIMKSLHAVHNQNLLHRDISPDNIIVMKDGSTRILDFGAARLAIDNDKSKSIILKHGFAPEEQYRKHGNQGPWSDEYALAATMYLILTGVMPPDAIERVHEDTLVSPIDLGVSMPQYANDALMKALSVHASGRFPDMKSFALAISGSDQAQSSSTAPLAASAVSPFAAAPSAASAPASSPAPAGAATPAASPLAPAAGASSDAGSKVTSPSTQKTKKSIWKRPLTYVVAGIVLLAGISVPLGLYFGGAFGSKDEETTTKKTKKTTTTTTTEEPT